MRKILLAAALGVATGALATFALIERQRSPLQPSPTVIGDVAKMSVTEADRHRKEGYASIRTIEDLLALPTDFAQTEALYALAGRSDSAEVQNLVFQADGIVDASDRSAATGILFSRLAELDVASALALSRTPTFRGDPDIERQVWTSWGALDLDAALRGAASLDSPAHRQLAAQALFAAYDYWGNERTAHIAEVLGVRPDRRTRSIYVSGLADADPIAAIEAIKAMASVLDRQEAALWLGRRLGTDPVGASAYADLFEDAALRRTFEDAVTYAAAEVEPLATVEGLLANGTSIENKSRLASAFRALAAQDIEEALALFDRLEVPRQRHAVSDALAELLVRTDPERALAWASANDRSIDRRLYTKVVSALADTRPELAIADVASLSDRWQRLTSISTVAAVLARRDPQQALKLLDHVKTPVERNMATQAVVSTWLQSDPDTALNWITATDSPERDNLMTTAATYLTRWDLDAAIRVLPRVGERHASIWRTEIATSLAAQRSIAEAQSFIAQFEGSADYERLFTATIKGLGRTDALAAIEMAARLPDVSQRTQLYNSLYRQLAVQDPRQAAASLPSIEDEEQRARITMQVASQWSRADPKAAQSWASNLPQGADRDKALAGITSSWEEITPARRLLIESIGNAELRKQVMIQAVFRMARLEPERAEQLLLGLDITHEERERMLQLIQSLGNGSFGRGPIVTR